MAGEPLSHSLLYSPDMSTSDARSPSPPLLPASKFTTEVLYQDIGDVVRDLSHFMQVTHIQKQVVDLNEQVKLLYDVSKELRALSSGQSSFWGLSPANQCPLDRLRHSVDIVGDRCRDDTLSLLHNRLARTITRHVDGHSPGVELKLPADDLLWYENTFKTLEVQTEALQVLLATIGLVRDSSTVTIGSNLSAVSKVHSLASSLNRKLYDSSR
jgi:hypothetical protein